MGKDICLICDKIIIERDYCQLCGELNGTYLDSPCEWFKLNNNPRDHIVLAKVELLWYQWDAMKKSDKMFSPPFAIYWDTFSSCVKYLIEKGEI